jgi:hypothetical protein
MRKLILAFCALSVLSACEGGEQYKPYGNMDERRLSPWSDYR